jgi:triacylglycerol lipase
MEGGVMTVARVKAPIVLVHGILGFDRLRLLGWPIATYFNGIREALEAAGNRVFTPTTTPTGSVAERAGELKAFLDTNLPDGPLHIIAHSMGGLDSRYLISRLDMAGRVQTLTTLGTPHRGTAFADWGTDHLGPAVDPFLELFGIPVSGFSDLRRDRCAEFNQDTPDADGVRYFSIAGTFVPDWLSSQWSLPYHIVARDEGPNDGLVSVDSARYGESFEQWPDCNHADLVNWPNPAARLEGRWHDRAPDYLAIVARLAGQGF